jgi:type IV secretion system protein TrbL
LVGGVLMPDCSTFDVLCKTGGVVSGAVGAVAGGVLDEVRKSAVEMTTTMLKTLGTFWLKIPSPSLDVSPGTGTGGGSGTGALGVLQSNLAFFTILAAVFGLVMCAAKMAITARGEHGAEGVKMLARLVGVAGAGAAVVALLVASGDAFAPWIIEQATGAPFEQSAPNIIAGAALTNMTALLAILVAVFALFGSLAQVLFMILRGGMLVVLVAVWPLAASLSSTEQGLGWYKKINAYLIAFVLFKPVAAILYSAGFLLLKDGNATTSDDPSVDATIGTLQGLALLTVAALALPALLRFVSPLTAAGSGSMSGAAALAGTVAVGAAVVTMGGGAAAAGAGGGGSAAGAASGGGSAGAGAAGAGGGAGAAGGQGPAGGGVPSGGGGGGADTGSSGGGGFGSGGGGGPSGGGVPSGGGGADTGSSSGGGSSSPPPSSPDGGGGASRPVPAYAGSGGASGSRMAAASNGVRVMTAAAENAATDHSEPSGARHEEQTP